MVLGSAPRELWLVYLASIAGTAAYGLVNMSLRLYLLQDLSLSREVAGGFLGAWALMISVSSFLAGCLSDAIGIRRTLIFSFALCAITRALSAVVQHPVLMPALALVPMALGIAMAIPVMVAALCRYTARWQRSLAFALLYVVPGRAVFIFRRTLRRHFLFRPDAELNELFLSRSSPAAMCRPAMQATSCRVSSLTENGGRRLIDLRSTARRSHEAVWSSCSRLLRCTCVGYGRLL